MKKIKFIVIAIISLITISSCTVDSNEQWYVQEFTVSARDWELKGGANQVGSYYQYVFDKVPLSTSYYNGIVTAYMFFDYDTSKEVQTALPYIEYLVGTNSRGQEVPYTVQFSYDIKADNTIAFKAHISDYWTGDFNPGTQDFRVAIIW